MDRLGSNDILRFRFASADCLSRQDTSLFWGYERFGEEQALRRRSLVFAALIASLTFGQAFTVRAQGTSTATRSPIGSPVEVTAGQEFYAETKVRKVPAYRLEKPFKSSMAGAMGFPFSFSIDSTLLVRVKDCAFGWECYIPENGAFRAAHGLLGSVIAPGDAVGLRVSGAGEMQWFVDNSIHNGMTTIWHRKLKKKDPTLTKVETDMKESAGGAVERLIYLGLNGPSSVRIRHERLFPGDIVRDEFTFPIDENGRGVGAVRGAEFAIEAKPLKAVITVTKPMTSGIGEIIPD